VLEGRQCIFQKYYFTSGLKVLISSYYDLLGFS
jgi:hypothetical protein